MKDHHPWTGKGSGRSIAWTGTVLLGLLRLAGSAWAGPSLPGLAPERAAPLAAAAKSAVFLQAGDHSDARMVATAAAHVEIKNYEYLPATLTVPAGTMVTWTSHDDEPHTVTSSETVFASPGLDADETFSYTFTTPGAYTYHCALHPHMNGTIIVK